LKVTSCGRTDTGRVRSANEDSLLVDDELGLYVVADGMGGHAAGEVASRTCIEVLQERVSADLGRDSEPRGLLTEAVGLANRKVHELSHESADMEGMGTTVVATLCRRGSLWIAHVGDSRAYLVRGGRASQVTEDHSVVAEQLRHNLITAEQARASEMRNVVTRAVGTEANVEVDVQEQTVAGGDVLLLCSDGLSNPLQPQEIAEALSGKDLCNGLEALIAKANERGGDDNMTGVALRIGGDASIAPVHVRARHRLRVWLMCWALAIVVGVACWGVLGRVRQARRQGAELAITEAQGGVESLERAGAAVIDPGALAEARRSLRKARSEYDRGRYADAADLARYSLEQVSEALSRLPAQSGVAGATAAEALHALRVLEGKLKVAGEGALAVRSPEAIQRGRDAMGEAQLALDRGRSAEAAGVAAAAIQQLNAAWLAAAESAIAEAEGLTGPDGPEDVRRLIDQAHRALSASDWEGACSLAQEGLDLLREAGAEGR